MREERKKESKAKANSQTPDSARCNIRPENAKEVWEDGRWIQGVEELVRSVVDSPKLG